MSLSKNIHIHILLFLIIEYSYSIIYEIRSFIHINIYLCIYKKTNIGKIYLLIKTSFY